VCSIVQNAFKVQTASLDAHRLVDVALLEQVGAGSGALGDVKLAELRHAVFDGTRLEDGLGFLD